MALAGVAIPVQIVRIQNSQEVAGVTGNGSYEWKTFYPTRGLIYDRNGNLLAGNKTVYEVGINLTYIPKDKDKGSAVEQNIALALQMTVGLDSTNTLQRMKDAGPDLQYIMLDDYI